MAGKRIVIPNYMPALDLTGAPVAGAKLYFYENETTTLKAIYTSAALSVQHPNPISANAAGVFASIFADEAEEFSVAITDADGNPISGLRNRDNVTPSLAILDGVDAPTSAAVASILEADTLNDFTEAQQFLQSGTGATSRTVRSKLRDTINAADFGLTGTGDETTTLQALLTAHAGKTIEFDDTYTVSSTVTLAGSNTTLRFRNGAGITYATATLIPFAVTGDNVTIEGMTVNAPATFDGVNTQPLYGCVWVTGDNCTIDGLTINNVPKVGVMFKDCEGGRVRGSRIIGNYPTASYTGTEVGHAGILIDCASGGREGNFIIEGNDVSECVQGVLIANYGSTSRSQGIIITGNNFYSIWNHGVYGAGINYANVVTGNAFVFCQVPVALSGSYHIVSDNTLTTGGSSGLYTDQTGISLRDPQHCVVSGNVLQGETGTNQILINLTVSLGTVVRGNIVQGNTCEITGSGSATMIALGGTTCTDLTDNLVQGNVCKGPGRLEIGLITLSGAASCPAQGTRVSHNSGVAKSSSHGVQLINLVGAVADNNSFRLEYDAAGVVQVCGVDMSACTNCEAHDNPTSITAAWGTNLQLVGIRESTSGSGNRAWNNSLRADPTKIVYGIPYFTVSGSGIFVDDGGAGAPNLSAGLGSTWRKTDGLTPYFYVKEVGTDASGWVGK